MKEETDWCLLYFLCIKMDIQAVSIGSIETMLACDYGTRTSLSGPAYRQTSKLTTYVVQVRHFIQLSTVWNQT